MSDSQEAKRERALQQRMQSMRSAGYGNIDDSILYRLAVNNPAGFNDMSGIAPGTALSPQQVQEVIGRLGTPGHYVGGDGMTLDRYLADPKSAIKLENGQYVYRPEAMQGDFESIDRESFLSSFGPFALAAGLMGGLPMLASMGIMGGAGAATGAGTEAAAAGAGMPAADFSLAGAGQGVGGVGSAGLGLNTAGMGLTPEMIAAGGGASAMGVGGGLGLQAVGTTGTALTGATMGAGAASGSGWWDTLLNTVTGSPGTTGASTLANFLKGGGSLLEWLQSKDNADELQKAIMSAADRGDPFASQRPFYQNMLRDSYTNPNFWKDNAVFKGISDVASSDAQRQAAARGFNNSSNVLYDVADRIQKTGMNYATNFQGQLAQNAGAGFSPGTSASIAAQGANQVMGANQQSNGALGNVISNIPNVVNGIKGLLA